MQKYHVPYKQRKLNKGAKGRIEGKRDKKEPKVYAMVLCRCGQRHEFYQDLGMGHTICTCGRTVIYQVEQLDEPAKRRPGDMPIYRPVDSVEELAKAVVDEIRPKELMLAAAKVFRPVELRCSFIQLQGWLIDLAKVWHAHIDSGHIMLSQLGGGVLIFENEDEAAALVPGANQLEAGVFHALAEYLKERFNATDVLTPVDKVFGKGSTDAGTVQVQSKDRGADSED